MSSRKHAHLNDLTFEAFLHNMEVCIQNTACSCRINNAGTNSYKYNTLSDLGENDIISIIETNVLGVMLCCREVKSLSSTTLPSR